LTREAAEAHALLSDLGRLEREARAGAAAAGYPFTDGPDPR
jgi:hypothetical protein